MITIALVILLCINVLSFFLSLYLDRDSKLTRKEAIEANKQYWQYTKELHESVLNLNKSVRILENIPRMTKEEPDKSSNNRESWTAPMYVHGNNNNPPGTITNIVKVKRKPGRPKKVKK